MSFFRFYYIEVKIMVSIDDDMHNIRNLLSRINSIFEIISEEGFQDELNENFLTSLKDLEKKWLDYTKKLEKNP